MTYLYVDRESEDTRSRFVTLTQQTISDGQVVVGSDQPLVTADVNHQRLHEGRAYYAFYLQNSGAPLADDASINIVFAAGPGVYPHLSIGSFCGGDCELFLYEGASSTGGASFTPIARNRQSTNTSDVAMVTNPTVTATGVNLLTEFLPGGAKKKAGGGGGDSSEYLLKPLTNYLVRLLNVSGSAQIAEITLEWYE